MAHKDEVRNAAFALYVQEKSYEEIGRILKVNRNTIARWHNEENWTQRLEDIKARTKEKLGEDIAEIRARQIKIAKAAQQDYVKHLQAEPGTTTYQDADRAMKHELLLSGEATEKIETLNKTISVNIIVPANGARNKLEAVSETV